MASSGKVYTPVEEHKKTIKQPTRAFFYNTSKLKMGMEDSTYDLGDDLFAANAGNQELDIGDPFPKPDPKAFASMASSSGSLSSSSSSSSTEPAAPATPPRKGLEKKEEETNEDDYYYPPRFTKASAIDPKTLIEPLQKREISSQILDLIPWQGLSSPHRNIDHASIIKHVATVIGNFCWDDTHGISDSFGINGKLNNKYTAQEIQEKFLKYCSVNGHAYEHEIPDSYQEELRHLNRLAKLLTLNEGITTETSPVCAVSILKNRLVIAYNDQYKFDDQIKSRIEKSCNAAIATLVDTYQKTLGLEESKADALIQETIKKLKTNITTGIQKKDTPDLDASLFIDIKKLFSSDLIQEISAGIIESTRILVQGTHSEKMHAEMRILKAIIQQHLIDQLQSEKNKHEAASALKKAADAKKKSNHKKAAVKKVEREENEDKEEENLTLFPNEPCLIGVSFLNCACCNATIQDCIKRTANIFVSGTHNLRFDGTQTTFGFWESVFEKSFLEDAKRIVSFSKPLVDELDDLKKGILNSLDKNAPPPGCSANKPGARSLLEDQSPDRPKEQGQEKDKNKDKTQANNAAGTASKTSLAMLSLLSQKSAGQHGDDLLEDPSVTAKNKPNPFG